MFRTYSSHSLQPEWRNSQQKSVEKMKKGRKKNAKSSHPSSSNDFKIWKNENTIISHTLFPLINEANIKNHTIQNLYMNIILCQCTAHSIPDRIHIKYNRIERKFRVILTNIIDFSLSSLRIYVRVCIYVTWRGRRHSNSLRACVIFNWRRNIKKKYEVLFRWFPSLMSFLRFFLAHQGNVEEQMFSPEHTIQCR